MNLCIDIGNTRIKAGFFEGTKLLRVEKYDSQLSNDLLAKWTLDGKTKHIILSSVKNLGSAEIEQLSKKYDLVVADYLMPIPFKMSYSTPKTLGVDRILGAIGAQSLFPNEATLSIDAGTCITYDIVNHGSYLGGAISPGLQMRLNAMHHFTDKLPELKISHHNVTFGHSTASSMQMGAALGAAHEFNGFIRQFIIQYPKLKVILTGGDSTFFERHAENAIFAAPNLVLHGLNSTLLEMKQKK